MWWSRLSLQTLQFFCGENILNPFFWFLRYAVYCPDHVHSSCCVGDIMTSCSCQVMARHHLIRLLSWPADLSLHSSCIPFLLSTSPRSMPLSYTVSAPEVYFWVISLHTESSSSVLALIHHRVPSLNTQDFHFLAVVNRAAFGTWSYFHGSGLVGTCFVASLCGVNL